MKFFKEKFNQLGKPLLLWIFSYKIFQSWAYPETQYRWTKFLIDDIFFRVLMYLVWIYSAYIVFIVYCLPTPLDFISFTDTLTPHTPPLTDRVKALAGFLFWVPGPHDFILFFATVIEFLTDLSFVLTTLPQLPWVVQKFLFWKILHRWAGPLYNFFWTKVFDWLGFNGKVDENMHNLFTWLLLKKPLNKNLLLDHEPFYPLILMGWNREKYNEWKKIVDSLPPEIRLIYEIKDMKSQVLPKKSLTACCTEFYITFFFWEKSNFLPQRDFMYLFNYNRYLMARFVVFSKSYDKGLPEGGSLEEDLKSFGISTLYSDKVKNDYNWGTTR